jgi:hypothetical protein
VGRGMISSDPEDRDGVPIWKYSHAARKHFDREKVYFAVSRNLLTTYFNNPAENVNFRQFCDHISPLVCEILWLRDRLEVLERQSKTLKKRVVNLGSPETLTEEGNADDDHEDS